MDRRVFVRYLCALKGRGGDLIVFTLNIPFNVFQGVILMTEQTTERAKCKKFKVKEVLTTLLKKGLTYLLMRPATWKFLMVNLPIWIEKLGTHIKEFVSYLIDLIP
jgi:hypothetical protein